MGGSIPNWHPVTLSLTLFERMPLDQLLLTNIVTDDLQQEPENQLFLFE
jgi:hypothetical protein